MAKLGTYVTKQRLGRETKTITVRKDIKQRQRDKGLTPGSTSIKSLFPWLFRR